MNTWFTAYRLPQRGLAVDLNRYSILSWELFMGSTVYGYVQDKVVMAMRENVRTGGMLVAMLHLLRLATLCNMQQKLNDGG